MNKDQALPDLKTLNQIKTESLGDNRLRSTLLGIFAVMHRHWPMTTKILAAATGFAACGTLIACCFVTRSGAGSMFAAQWFVVFLPFLLFWSGAWLRRRDEE